MKVIAICEMCGCKFSYQKRRGCAGRLRRFCDECRAVRNREAVRRSCSKEPLPDDFTGIAETVDPLPDGRAFGELVKAEEARRARAVRETVDRLLAKHCIRQRDAADQSAVTVTVRVVNGVRIETRR